ncbi:uncharacterized protein B0I36DRAFT_294801 [Microdochium trichocladiopsis]|uniref:Glycoside hydrolase family 43 protein n=1 Tax=Microdochium trichocladiopsis TaxID=1682393 RepID=A0A9P8Y0Q7_9PEZI|nr:uncharacterized protein B0I36DRAFT_294801 [Microdochium trichocladiopsis]KAH7026659.1 hypothetical protein B0I36DRAFT_294801 [Microdochium trichocladiopsis]
MMLRQTLQKVVTLASLVGVWGQDDLGLGNGFLTLNTTNFSARIVRNAQVLASLKPAGEEFDFLPADYLSRRARNGQYHWGDITFRHRQAGTSDAWINGDTAVSRQPVTVVSSTSSIDEDGNKTNATVLAAADLSATLPSTMPLSITREWLEVDGDLALRFTLRNPADSNNNNAAIEIGSLGFPAEFNSIFTDRHAADMQRLCSLSDPYIGMHAGHIRVSPIRGSGSALVVTPLAGTDTPMEAYRNLYEAWYADTGYGSQTFEGFYEWQVLSKAWAENEWAANGAKPWNEPSSRVLEAGASLTFGLRFSVVKDGVRGFDAALKEVGVPVAQGVPGYIVPQGEPAELLLQYSAGEVTSIVSTPPGALDTARTSDGGRYTVTPSASAWGRARLTVAYADGKTQTVHYYITKPGTQALADMGRFLTTEQYFTDTSDPFGRAPSVITYDYEARSLVLQDSRAWVAGLSDEGGAGAFVAAFMKQAVLPDADEVGKLEAFIDQVIWNKTLQLADYAVRKSTFYYDPATGYPYDKSLDWTSWTSWDRTAAYATDRAYDYVHVAAAYWAMYRVARAYPDLTPSHGWEWYLEHAHGTVMRAMEWDVGYNRVGLMGETVFGEILTDLRREGGEEWSGQADGLEEAMRSRAVQWDGEEVPYGSEMAWDSTGQEGVYYWAKHFNLANTVDKTINSVLGFMPTVPHWGWNGNARRYWDNYYGGKLRRLERQIHHYGSGLNAQVLLGAFRSNPQDSYLLRVGYGGISGPMSNINAEGFAAASFHSWPDTLKWDGISGDYGPGFLGLALNTGTYIAQDPSLGLVAYGGTLSVSNGTATVRTTDPTRRKVFVGPLGLLVYTDAGIISEVSYRVADAAVSGVTVRLSQLPGVPVAKAANVWVEQTAGAGEYQVSLGSGVAVSRGGWRVELDGTETVDVHVVPA